MKVFTHTPQYSAACCRLRSLGATTLSVQLTPTDWCITPPIQSGILRVKCQSRGYLSLQKGPTSDAKEITICRWINHPVSRCSLIRESGYERHQYRGGLLQDAALHALSSERPPA